MRRIEIRNNNNLQVIEADFTEIEVEVTAAQEIEILQKDLSCVMQKAIVVLKKAERMMGFAKVTLSSEFKEIQSDLEQLGWKFVALQKYMKTRDRIFMKVAMENAWNNLEDSFLNLKGKNKTTTNVL